MMDNSKDNHDAQAKPSVLVPRRKFITAAAAGGLGVAASLWTFRNSTAGDRPPAPGRPAEPGLYTDPGRFAEELTKTPAMAEGPFYPDKLPLDTDNDLLILNDAITPAVGQITHLSGRVLTTTGKPIGGAFVELWQVDSRGIYLHSRSSGADKRDTNFQGYGRFLTSRKGEYYFRTVKPVSYPGRAPHLHLAVSINGHRVLTTQMLTRGNANNVKDGLFRRFKDQSLRDALTAQYKPIAESKLGELAVQFDLVLGVTPDENAPITGGVAKPTRR